MRKLYDLPLWSKIHIPPLVVLAALLGVAASSKVRARPLPPIATARSKRSTRQSSTPLMAP